MIRRMLKQLLLFLLKPVYNVTCINRFRAVHTFLMWNAYSATLKSIGANSRVGNFFSIHGGEYIEIGENFRAGYGLILEAWDEYEGEHYNPRLRIGDHVVFTDYDHISCVDSVEIGNYTLLGRNVYISDNSHGKTDQIGRAHV